MLDHMPRRQRHQWDPICDPPQNLVRPVPIDPDRISGPTRGQAKRGKWRRTTHGLYVPVDVDRSVPEQRILEKSMLLRPSGAVTGWASLRLMCANFFDGLLADRVTERPVALTVPRDRTRRQREGVVFSQDRLDESEVQTRYGIRCTRVHRGLFDEMRKSPDLREAVVAMDMAAAAQLISVARMKKYVDRRASWDGVPLVRAALDLADEDSRSPNETRMRMIWQLDAGFARPMVNQEVWDLNGRLLGIADILDPVAGVVGEFDGADHRGALRHSKDVDREARFRNHDLEFFRVTGLDLPERAKVVGRMESSMGRARFLPPGRRSWTVTPPPGWEIDPPLDYILELRDQHEQWERDGAPDLRDLIGR